MSLLSLLLALAGVAHAGPAYDLTLHGSTATLRVAGAVKVAVSSASPTTVRILLEGTSGGVTASSFVATYGITAATTNFTATMTAVGVQAKLVNTSVGLFSDYGVRAATGSFTTGITVGTLSVTGASDFRTVAVSSQNGTAMMEVTRFGVINSTTQAAARWTRTTTLSIANNTNTILKLVNKEYDTQALFAVTHATVPTGMDGIYSIRAFVSWAQDPDGRRNINVLKNGTGITGCSDVKDAVDGIDETRINVGCSPHLVAGDAISVSLYHDEGAALNVNSASLEIVKIW